MTQANEWQERTIWVRVRRIDSDFEIYDMRLPDGTGDWTIGGADLDAATVPPTITRERLDRMLHGLLMWADDCHEEQNDSINAILDAVCGKVKP